MRRMRAWTEDNEGNEASIDMSPLIDIVFILLIFFIVTTVFVNEAGVEVQKPAKTASTQRLDSQSILIAVTKEGAVYHAGRDVGAEGVSSVCEAVLAGGSQVPVIIQGDKEAPHGVIMKVKNACFEAGIEKVYDSTLK